MRLVGVLVRRGFLPRPHRERLAEVVRRLKDARIRVSLFIDPDLDQVKESLRVGAQAVVVHTGRYADVLGEEERRTELDRVADAASGILQLLDAQIRLVLARVDVPKNVKVSTRLTKELPSVLADHDQLTQVLSNIVRNAVQAMPEGGRLAVKTWQAKGEGAATRSVAVSVKDSGIGIAEGNLHRVFEPLFTTKAKGIGLGLALSKTLIEAHGGSIDVESQEGKGSAFIVTLPLSGSA